MHTVMFREKARHDGWDYGEGQARGKRDAERDCPGIALAERVGFRDEVGAAIGETAYLGLEQAALAGRDKARPVPDEEQDSQLFFELGNAPADSGLRDAEESCSALGRSGVEHRGIGLEK
jgi:hypothetical protein